MTPAEKMRELRAQTGLTQKAFCEKYGIPKRTVEDWERGVRIPPTYVLNLLEQVINNK